MLSDPNKNLTPAEIRLGKGQKIKTLTKKENKHEKILLGNLYRDKEFLRWTSLLLNQKIFKHSQVSGPFS